MYGSMNLNNPPPIVWQRPSPSHEEFIEMAKQCIKHMDAINKIFERMFEDAK